MEPLSSLLTSLRTVDPNTLDQEYSMVRSLASSSKRELGLTTEAGALKENVKKNRYKDILPYDQSRVVLSLVTEDSDSDYINASFIKQGAAGDRQYIAAQAPLSTTLIDFWKMIWQYDIKVIVMACREIEMGKRKSECYWSPVHQSSTFGPFTVSTEEKRPSEDLIIRSLTVSFQQETRSLIQYQFLAWPDHDVPDEASSVLQLLDRVRASHGTHTSPLLVHCSAGCGRTGVICALDHIHDLLVTKVSGDFSIRNLVLDLRRQRPSAVQTKDQYQFIFTAAAAMLEQMLQASKQVLYSNLPQPKKKPEKKTSRTLVSSTKRHSQPVAMSDTYAVVNKSKHPQSPPPGSAFAASITPRSSHAGRSSSSHHYDNEGSAAAPIYSTVKPRTRPGSQQPSAPPLYDTAAPANDRPDPDDDYENMSPPVTDAASPCSPGGIGFNCRIQKPRGPRDPPAEWSRLER